MKCPLCQKEMQEIQKDLTSNFDTGKRYSRVIFNCKKDDVWISVETPITKQMVA
jgi:hypothetical protein